MKKFFRILLWILVGVIFVGTFVFLYLNSKPEEVRYELVKPTMGSVEKTAVLTGTVEPRDEIAIKPQISGIISQINVEAGDMVKPGDVIAVIKVIPDAQQLSSAENRLNLAQINLKDVEIRHNRNTKLYERKVIAREEYETTLAELNRAKEEVIAARDAVGIVKQGVSQYNASESNTQVRATTAGLVLDVPVKVGTSVIQANTFNDGTTIATVADMNNLIFKGNVDETEVGLLYVGMPMNITIGAMPALHPTATIEYIAPKGTENNGANTFEIKAALQLDSSEGLRAGYSANAAVVLDRAENVVTVPESVVEYAADKTYVYVQTDSVPKAAYDRREVTTGLSDGMKVEIKSGIDSTAVLRGEKIK